MELFWLGLGIVTFAAMQVGLSTAHNNRVRTLGPWVFAILAGYTFAAFVPLPPDRDAYGWPALSPTYLLEVGTAWCVALFESLAIGRLLLRKPRTAFNFIALCSAGTFVAWAVTLWSFVSLRPGS